MKTIRKEKRGSWKEEVMEMAISETGLRIDDLIVKSIEGKIVKRIFEGNKQHIKKISISKNCSGEDNV